MNERLDAESPEVQRFLADLAALPEATEPVPSPDLAAYLAGGPAPVLAPVPGPRRSAARKVAAGTATAVLVVAAGTGWAAAANELPAPLQNAIADLSDHHYLPFTVPHSTEGGRGEAPGIEKNGLLPVEQLPTRGQRGRTSGPDDNPDTGTGKEQTDEGVVSTTPDADTDVDTDTDGEAPTEDPQGSPAPASPPADPQTGPTQGQDDHVDNGEPGETEDGDQEADDPSQGSGAKPDNAPGEDR